MKALPITRHEKEPPKRGLTYKTNNPLEHLTAFEPGDAIRATDPGLGLEVGVPYLIQGYWYTPEFGMYVYIRATANAMHKSYRFANTEGRIDEVLFCLLDEYITELDLRSYQHGLDYVPARDIEVPMWPNREPDPEPVERDNVIPLMNDKGQYVFPFYQIA